MHAYQRECDERVRREVEIQMEVFRDSEIGRIRLQESQRARTELQSLRNEMEAEYNRRAQSNSAREAEAARANAERERKAQLAGYESRQQLQRELDEMRAREQVSLSLLLSPLSLSLNLSLDL
jgi:oral-facial-digital syndrome 1 protein